MGITNFIIVNVQIDVLPIIKRQFKYLFMWWLKPPITCITILICMFYVVKHIVPLKHSY